MSDGRKEILGSARDAARDMVVRLRDELDVDPKDEIDGGDVTVDEVCFAFREAFLAEIGEEAD